MLWVTTWLSCTAVVGMGLLLLLLGAAKQLASI